MFVSFSAPLRIFFSRPKLNAFNYFTFMFPANSKRNENNKKMNKTMAKIKAETISNEFFFFFSFLLFFLSQNEKSEPMVMTSDSVANELFRNNSVCIQVDFFLSHPIFRRFVQKKILPHIFSVTCK